MLKGLGQTFKRPGYTLLALAIAIVVFTFAVWLPNFKFIADILSSEVANLNDKASIIFGLYGSIGTNFTVVSAIYTILIALLFGMNVSLLTYYIRSQKKVLKGKDTASGLGGLVAGVFGVGCASCGTFILTSVLGLLGVGGVIAYLPLGGEEFGILGVMLLLYSVYALGKRIEAPLVCEPEPQFTK